MRVNSIFFDWNDGMGTGKFYRINAIALLLAALISLNFSAKAKVFTATLSGNYNDQNIWVPSYPGNIIKETDTVYIANSVKLTSDIVVKGVLMVRMSGSLMGTKHLVILPEGKLMNFGITIANGINNKGLLYNKHIIEIANDLINSGEIVNQESMVVGNITDNIGLITGQGGSLLTNKKFVNSQTGVLRGSIDVCSNSFMNVDGGTIDSTRLSFCGQRIFSNVYLTADIRRDNIVLSLKNGDNEDYKKFRVERSVDGINYKPIATITKPENGESFRYVDEEVVKSNSIFYRLKVIREDDSETFIPAVEVGNMLSSDSGGEKF